MTQWCRERPIRVAEKIRDEDATLQSAIGGAEAAEIIPILREALAKSNQERLDEASKMAALVLKHAQERSILEAQIATIERRVSREDDD